MSDLRQTVRRDDDLPPIARLLFAEIWQMNESGGECYAEDDWLGEQIGAAESTVRKHRLTLRRKGYIKQSKSGGRRYLEPNEVINTDQSDQNQSENISNDDQSDQNRSDEVINSDQHRGSNNPEGASSRARGDGERWGFLPSYRMRHLPEIKREAEAPEEQADVLDIATRHLGGSQEDLASIVDYHREQRPDDQVIAAYVIAGREADSPLEYADKIIREGWKESSSPAGGDGIPRGRSIQERHGDQDVIHFGSNRS